MNTTLLLIPIMLLASCAGSSMRGKKLLTQKELHLFRVSSNPKNYPFGLWNVNPTSNPAGAFKITDVPKGQVLVVDQARLDPDFYGPGFVDIKGTLTYRGQVYRVKSSCLTTEYPKLFAEVP